MIVHDIYFLFMTTWYVKLKSSLEEAGVFKWRWYYVLNISQCQSSWETLEYLLSTLAPVFDNYFTNEL